MLWKSSSGMVSCRNSRTVVQHNVACLYIYLLPVWCILSGAAVAPRVSTSVLRHFKEETKWHAFFPSFLSCSRCHPNLLPEWNCPHLPAAVEPGVDLLRRRETWCGGASSRAATSAVVLTLYDIRSCVVVTPSLWLTAETSWLPCWLAGWGGRGYVLYIWQPLMGSALLPNRCHRARVLFLCFVLVCFFFFCFKQAERESLCSGNLWPSCCLYIMDMISPLLKFCFVPSSHRFARMTERYLCLFFVFFCVCLVFFFFNKRLMLANLPKKKTRLIFVSNIISILKFLLSIWGETVLDQNSLKLIKCTQTNWQIYWGLYI